MIIDSPDEFCFGTVGRGEVVMQIPAELDDTVLDPFETAEQGHAVAGEPMQVDGVPALGAGDMRLAGKLCARRWQLADLSIVLAHPREPPVRVRAAVTPRRPPGAACGAIDLAPRLINLFSELLA